MENIPEEEKQVVPYIRYQIETPTRSRMYNLFSYIMSNPQKFASLTIAVSGILLYVFKDSPLFYSFIMNILSNLDFTYSFFFVISVYYTFPIIQKFCNTYLRNSVMCGTIMLFVFHISTTYFVGFYRLLTHSQTILSKNFAVFSTNIRNLVSKTFMDLQNLLQEFVFDAQTNPELARNFIHDLRLVMTKSFADGASFILFSHLYLSNMQNLDVLTSFFQTIRKQIANTDDELFVDEFEQSYEDIKKDVQKLTVNKIEEYTQAFLTTIYRYVGTDIIITTTEEEKQHEELVKKINNLKKNVNHFDNEFQDILERLLKRSAQVKSQIETAKSQQEKNILVKELNELNRAIEKSLIYSVQIEKARNVKSSLTTFVGELEQSALSFDKFNINFYEFMGGIDCETGHLINDTIIRFKRVLQNDLNFQEDTPITFGGKMIKWLDFSKALSRFVLTGEDPMQTLRDGGDKLLNEFLLNLQSSNFIKQTRFLKQFINDRRFENFITKFRFNYIMLLEEVSTTLAADRYLLLKDLQQTFSFKTKLLRSGEKTGNNILGSVAGVIGGVEEATGFKILDVKEIEKNTQEYQKTLQEYQEKFSKKLSENTKKLANTYVSGYIPDCIIKDECITLTAQSVNRLEDPVSVSIVLPTISVLFMIVIIILGIFRKSTCCPKRQQYRFEGENSNSEKDVLIRLNQIFY